MHALLGRGTLVQEMDAHMDLASFTCQILKAELERMWLPEGQRIFLLFRKRLVH